MIRSAHSPVASGPPLVIVGASVRAAAWSALRAGFRPLCVDQFADADLAAVAPVIKVGPDPQEFIAAAAQYPAAPLMYTGGLENHPDVVAQLAAERPLWGMDAAVLRAVRDPLAVSVALAGSRLPALGVCRADEPPPADGTWLLKPLRSAGGRGITVWSGEAEGSPVLQEPHYFQQRLEGPSYSGVFIGREGVGDVRFVGLTEQLVGTPWLNGRSFAWCGNIGPAFLDVRIEHAVRRIANFLKWKFGLRGLFGVDFVVAADGRLGVTEVNPRYPASLELLEYATGTALLADHARCFTSPELELPGAAWTPAPDVVLGKGVVYAPSESIAGTLPSIADQGFRQWPDWADVPASPQQMRTGEPVLTVYAQGKSAAECLAQLQQRARDCLAGSE